MSQSDARNLSGKERRRQSIIAGGLISSAGVFIAKFIGLFYVVPFNVIMDSTEYMNIYGQAFNIYSYVLNVSTAGFPFAVATMVARYASHGDYKTSLLIRKLSISVMLVLGFSMMCLLILFSNPLANLLIKDEAGVAIMQNVLIVVSLALFFVPLLSVLRGFYQGFKEMELYALSQVIEQVSRVAFLLGISALAVYALDQDRVWSVYIGAFSTSISAILAIVHIKFHDRKELKNIKREAAIQRVKSNEDRGLIFKELILIAIPYLFTAMLGYSDTIINTGFMSNGLIANGYATEDVYVITGAINYGVLKLMAIPMILAPGFSVAIIPYISNALAKKDRKMVRRYVNECMDSVIYLGVPVCFCLLVFAKPIYYVMFGGGGLDMTSSVLQWYSVEALISTILPVMTSLLMAIGLRKLTLRNLSIHVGIKFIITYPLIVYFGYQGAVVSSIIATSVLVWLDLKVMKKHFSVSWKVTFRRLCIVCLGCLGIAAVAYGSEFFLWSGYGDRASLGQWITLAFSGGFAIVVYFAITYFFQLPQAIFNLDLSRFMKRGKRS